MKQLRTAIVGATGTVGRETLRLLEETVFLDSDPVVLASAQSDGEDLDFAGDTLTVKNVETFDFNNIDLAIFATDNVVARQYVPKALEAGCYIIDASSAYRLDKTAAMVVPEINGNLIQKDTKIYASPDAAATQLALVLAALEKKSPIKRAVVTSMMSVSSAGRDAMDELFAQSAAMIGGAGAEQAEPFHFSTQMAFNVLPQVGGFEANGMTNTEQSMIIEVNKLINSTVPMSVTNVHVPTFVGTAQSVTVELEGPVTADEARSVFTDDSALCVIDNPKEQEYSTPFGSAETDVIYVSRVREDQSAANCLSMWLVADNLRKGSALNIVDIAEKIAEVA